jgi:hypothetical protein
MNTQPLTPEQETHLEAAGYRCECAGPCSKPHARNASRCSKTAGRVAESDGRAIVLCDGCTAGRVSAAMKTATTSARRFARGTQLDILSLFDETEGA